MAVIRPEISTDPAELEEIAFEYLGEQFRGWEPADGDLTTWLIRAHARMVAEERDVAADVPFEQILRPFGEKIHGVTPRVARPAEVKAVVTLRDGKGYTIPAGTEVLVRTSGDDGVTMAVTEDVTVPAPRQGERGVTTADVTLRAIAGREGTAGNGLRKGVNDVVPIRPLEFIASIELVEREVSSGGSDAETDEQYLQRLVDELALTSPVPILPDDFAQLARQTHESVGRALALNTYDPGTGTYGHERTVTVVVATAAGEPVPEDARRGVQARLEAMRELNWRCPVIDPTYTRIDVTFEATAWPGENPATVTDAALAALRFALSPANWGTGPGAGANPGWHDDPTVRYLEVAQVLNEVPGLRYVDSLQIGLQSRALGTADIELTGPGALPRPGTGINGTVTGG